jgi:hypothetical protein
MFTASDGENMEPFKISDISVEEWREYDFCGRVYRIESPKELYTKHGSKNHRIVDSTGIVHLVPGPGVDGCVLRWKAKDENKPVAF